MALAAGTKLSASQLASLATYGGWPAAEVPRSVAVALAESQGYTEAEGDVALEDAKWGPSVGPWQVRSLKAQRGTGGVRDELALLNASFNARSAHSIWVEAGNSFSPWSTYKSGAYLLYMPAASQGFAGSRGPWDPSVIIGGAKIGAGVITGSGAIDAAGAPIAAAKGLGNLVEIIAHAGAWLGDSHNLLRVALAVAGGALMVGGALVVARPAVESAGETVSKFAPK